MTFARRAPYPLVGRTVVVVGALVVVVGGLVVGAAVVVVVVVVVVSGTQTPFSQTALGQTAPQVPQLVGSVWKSTVATVPHAPLWQTAA